MNQLKTLFKRWIYSVDRVSVFALAVILAISMWVSIASTPAVALRLGYSPFHFVKNHMMVMPIGMVIILFFSFLQNKQIRKLSLVIFIFSFILTVSVIFFGEEIKGAKRWINLPGFSLQPSEFLKPSIAILTAWFLAEQYRDRKFPGIILSMVLMALVLPVLLMQPDIGMSVVIISTWIGQLFISGLSVYIFLIFFVIAIVAGVSLYVFFPHFQERMNRFIYQSASSSSSDELYQVRKSIEAFKGGGIWGKGPGEGVVKTLVPDAHSDFVFSVIGEEFGFIICLIIIVLLLILLIRPLIRIMNSTSMFSYIAVFGIVIELAIQIFINLGTSLNLIPTKGLTLPFISYGGSSFLSSSISVGLLLALTKRQNIYREKFSDIL